MCDHHYTPINPTLAQCEWCEGIVNILPRQGIVNGKIRMAIPAETIPLKPEEITYQESMVLCGVSRSAIHRACVAGHFRRIRPGVYDREAVGSWGLNRVPEDRDEAEIKLTGTITTQEIREQYGVHTNTITGAYRRGHIYRIKTGHYDRTSVEAYFDDHRLAEAPFNPHDHGHLMTDNG